MVNVNEIHTMTDSLAVFDESLEEGGLLEQVDFHDEEGTDMDMLGAEQDLDDALDDEYEGYSDSDDLVDDKMNALIDAVAVEYEDDDAFQAVFDAVDSLMKDGSIEDMPSREASPDEKARWAHNYMPKIRNRLRDFGVDFDDATG